MKKLLLICVAIFCSVVTINAQEQNTKTIMEPVIGIPANRIPEGGTLFSYDLSILPKKGDLKGPYHIIITKGDLNTRIITGKLSTEAAAMVAMIRPGDKVFYDEIKAKGPDGRMRTLQPFSQTMK